MTETIGHLILCWVFASFTAGTLIGLAGLNRNRGVPDEQP
jgi:hypothetical protein